MELVNNPLEGIQFFWPLCYCTSNLYSELLLDIDIVKTHVGFYDIIMNMIMIHAWIR